MRRIYVPVTQDTEEWLEAIAAHHGMSVSQLSAFFLVEGLDAYKRKIEEIEEEEYEDKQIKYPGDDEPGE